ncbi:uncharacterized protein EI97DRAFT_497650 [Westerdykella ornata]|uniref:Uncharacterized protein n=1 Tax=Westerdykella ornata TaxID=318751 RepID=A0A6A6K0R8_WESOR|nr:uncharacterized protein EI97DRAFT_497650 [Westerdykella ornata]KAF2280929.1 hypothetical protein EI97DRAFT_497650 [Westerdykella ornata]
MNKIPPAALLAAHFTSAAVLWRHEGRDITPRNSAYLNHDTGTIELPTAVPKHSISDTNTFGQPTATLSQFNSDSGTIELATATSSYLNSDIGSNELTIATTPLPPTSGFIGVPGASSGRASPSSAGVTNAPIPEHSAITFTAYHPLSSVDSSKIINIPTRDGDYSPGTPGYSQFYSGTGSLTPPGSSANRSMTYHPPSTSTGPNSTVSLSSVAYGTAVTSGLGFVWPTRTPVIPSSRVSSGTSTMASSTVSATTSSETPLQPTPITSAAMNSPSGASSAVLTSAASNPASSLPLPLTSTFPSPTTSHSSRAATSRSSQDPLPSSTTSLSSRTLPTIPSSAPISAVPFRAPIPAESRPLSHKPLETHPPNSPLPPHLSAPMPPSAPPAQTPPPTTKLVVIPTTMQPVKQSSTALVVVPINAALEERSELTEAQVPGQSSHDFLSRILKALADDGSSVNPTTSCRQTLVPTPEPPHEIPPAGFTCASGTTSECPPPTPSCSLPSKSTCLSSLMAVTLTLTRPTPTAVPSCKREEERREEIVTTLVREGPHCPYPYPGERCGSSATMFVTVTKTVEYKKETETGDWCPYPGQRC